MQVGLQIKKSPFLNSTTIPERKGKTEQIPNRHRTLLLAN